MKKILLILSSCMLFTGCATFGDGSRGCAPSTAKQVEYIIKIPPKELMTLPPAVEPVDARTAKQSDIAQWIIRNEERSKTLEDIIRQLAQFFRIEQLKLDDAAAEKNKTNEK